MPKHYLKNTICFALAISSIAFISSPLISNLYAQDTLTEEQINEVEKDPHTIIQGCSYRLGLKLDRGKLCDAFSTYLHDKCERLDYLSDYCGPLAVYFPKRIIQKQCISNPPLPPDIEGIERCVNYVVFSSTYADIPLRLTLKGLDFDINDAAIKISFSVFNPNALVVNLISISLDIHTTYGNKLPQVVSVMRYQIL